MSPGSREDVPSRGATLSRGREDSILYQQSHAYTALTEGELPKGQSLRIRRCVQLLSQPEAADASVCHVIFGPSMTRQG